MTPSLYYRVDLARYFIGLRTMRNCYTLKQGGADNRPGSKFVGEVKDSTKKVRLFNFIDSGGQNYILEFGDLYMRPFKNGAPIYLPAQSITNITQANPAVLTYSGIDYQNGDEVYLSGIGGMTELNGRHFKVANVNIGANTFELTDLGGTNIDSTGFGAYTSGGTVEEVYEMVTTYNEAATQSLSRTILYGLRRNSDTDWEFYDFSGGIDVPKFGPTVSLSVADGAACKYTAMAVNAFGQPSPATYVDTGNANPSSGAPITITLGAVTDADPTEYYIFRADTIGGKISQEDVYGLVGIRGGKTTGSVTFVDNGIDPDYALSPDERTVYSPPSDARVLFQNRLIYGGGSVLVGSEISKWSVFSFIESPTDSSPFSFSGIGGGRVNIKHLVDFGKLVILTDVAEFVAFGNEAGVITPTAINVRQQSAYGTYTTDPLVVDSTLFFVQAGGSVVRGYRYDISGDGYNGTDTTLFSSHLFRGYTIDFWDFQRIPHNILWAVRSDGTLLGFTYDKENEMAAWHRHDFPGGIVEDVAVAKEGSKDRVYLVIRRTIDGRSVRYVERLSDRYQTDVRDFTFMDSHLTYDGRHTGTDTMTLSGGTTWAYDETLTLTASTSFFVVSDVGNQIQIKNGSGDYIRFTIEGYTSATVVTGKPHKTVPTGLRGVATTNWAKAVDEAAGLWHLEGRTCQSLLTALSWQTQIMILMTWSP